MTIILIGIFFIGLILGSFYNVVALRTLSGESLSFPASHCTVCNHKLNFLDLFPVLSWVFLRGKCRYCGDKISYVYPVGELLTASAYTLIAYQFGFTLEALIQIIFITFMVFATTTDLKETMVPDRFVIIGSVLVIALRIISGVNLYYYLISGIVSFGILFLIMLLSNGKMGGADVKLYGLIGLAIGIQNSIGSLFYASMIALLFHLPMLIKNKGKITKNKEIPFVPFITLGVLCTYFLDFFKF